MHPKIPREISLYQSRDLVQNTKKSHHILQNNYLSGARCFSRTIPDREGQQNPSAKLTWFHYQLVCLSLAAHGRVLRAMRRILNSCWAFGSLSSCDAQWENRVGRAGKSTHIGTHAVDHPVNPFLKDISIQPRAHEMSMSCYNIRSMWW